MGGVGGVGGVESQDVREDDGVGLGVGMFHRPPRTWQILWCIPVPAEAKATAERYPPYRASSLYASAA